MGLRTILDLDRECLLFSDMLLFVPPSSQSRVPEICGIVYLPLARLESALLMTDEDATEDDLSSTGSSSGEVRTNMSDAGSALTAWTLACMDGTRVIFESSSGQVDPVGEAREWVRSTDNALMQLANQISRGLSHAFDSFIVPLLSDFFFIA